LWEQVPNAMSYPEPIQQAAFDVVVKIEMPPLKLVLIYTYPARKLEQQSCQLKSCSLQV
jgi:hypothetical protein